jgi:hypothetical protein
MIRVAALEIGFTFDIITRGVAIPALVKKEGGIAINLMVASVNVLNQLPRVGIISTLARDRDVI